ncbi:hypothetical protein EON62_01245, partial [archaeon]
MSVILSKLRSSEIFAPHELRFETDVPLASEAQVLRAHSDAYFRLVKTLAAHVRQHNYTIPFTPHIQRGLRAASDEPLEVTESPDVVSDTTFSTGSLPAALRAAGAVCTAIDAVVEGRSRHAFCCVRPPGHHAGVNGLLTDFASSQSCGFCIFNSVAIGALHALEAHKDTVRRVAIIDIDIHHGNGTEEIVRRWADSRRGKNNQSIFFFSTHLFDVERERRDAGDNDGAASSTAAAADAAATAPAPAPASATSTGADVGGAHGEGNVSPSAAAVLL